MHPRSMMDRSWLLTSRIIYLLAAFVATATPALAHQNTGLGVGFVSGFTHPLTGIDHILAMVAVGIWGTQLGKPAVWLLPVTFPLVMSIGGVLGVRGVPIQGVEIGVAASAVVLGVMILLATRPPLWVAAVIVGVFAIFHGHAHGTELPTAAYPLAYGAGFVLSTGLLHVTGIVIGLIDRWPAGARPCEAWVRPLELPDSTCLSSRRGEYETDHKFVCRQSRSYGDGALAHHNFSSSDEGRRRSLCWGCTRSAPLSSRCPWSRSACLQQQSCSR